MFLGEYIVNHQQYLDKETEAVIEAIANQISLKMDNRLLIIAQQAKALELKHNDLRDLIIKYQQLSADESHESTAAINSQFNAARDQFNGFQSIWASRRAEIGKSVTEINESLTEMVKQLDDLNNRIGLLEKHLSQINKNLWPSVIILAGVLMIAAYIL